MIYLFLFKCILFFVESFVVMKETSAFQFIVDHLHNFVLQKTSIWLYFKKKQKEVQTTNEKT